MATVTTVSEDEEIAKSTFSSLKRQFPADNVCFRQHHLLQGSAITSGTPARIKARETAPPLQHQVCKGAKPIGRRWAARDFRRGGERAEVPSAAESNKPIRRASKRGQQKQRHRSRVGRRAREGTSG